MSVVAQSPYTSGKRLFEEDASSTDSPHQHGAKRGRFDSPAGRCRPSTVQAHHSHVQAGVHPTAVAALKSLFPDMDEQAVESALAECGQDIDAAIRRLTELKLNNAEQQAQARAAMAASSQQHDTASVADGGQQHQQQQVPPGPQTAEQWVDAIVQEMAAAKDFTDARGRAAKMLQAFEQFIRERSKEVRSKSTNKTCLCGCCATGY
eukprot:GHRQ01005841.1.p1 GENE.GHRQ01005841.1~~GHRQ01005841.1.p1  ORF type:complete len:207 (+),score=47.49 GHRQ01005841.1:273-893(+)